MGSAAIVMDDALTRALDIRRVLAQGRRTAGRRVNAHVLTVPGHARVAFTSSRAVGGAVDRNRARRLMREAWRKVRPRVAADHWIVLVARPQIAGARMDEVAGDLEQVLASAGVIG